MEHSLRSPSRPALPNEPSRRARAARRIQFSRSLHSFVRKRLEQWLPGSEFSAELFRQGDGALVRCHLEVHGGGFDFVVDELAHGAQQALELCAREAQEFFLAHSHAPVPA